MTDTDRIKHLAEIRERAEAAQRDPFFVSDCEGALEVWRESALTWVSRDADGGIIGYSFPSSYRATDQVLEIDLDTWDPGEDVDDDQRRADIKGLVRARQTDVPWLLAEVDRLRALLAAQRSAVLDEAERKIRTTDLPDWYETVDLFENGATWAADLVKRMAADGGGERG